MGVLHHLRRLLHLFHDRIDVDGDDLVNLQRELYEFGVYRRVCLDYHDWSALDCNYQSNRNLNQKKVLPLLNFFDDLDVQLTHSDVTTVL